MMINNLTNQYINAMAVMQYKDLTVSASGSGDVATGRLYPSCQLVVDVTVGSAGKMITTTINTPIAFQVIDAASKNPRSTSTSFTVQILNGTTAITDSLIINGDKALTRVTTIDEDEDTFAVDDNDLVVKVSGSSTGSVLVVIDILLI